jgi:hypothetical protein
MGKLTKCKTCKKRIARDAPTCPRCGALEPGAHAASEKRRGPVGCVIILLLLGGSVFFAVDPLGLWKRPKSPAPPEHDPTARVRPPEPEPDSGLKAQPPADPTSTDESTVALPQYTLVETRDVGFADVVRKRCCVRVDRELTVQELMAASDKIVQQATEHERINAISISYYLPESDTEGAYTAGKADWAPDGDWNKADTDLAPKLVVTTGSAVGPVPEDIVVDLPVETKQQLFLHIVLKEYQGKNGTQSEVAVAREFGITGDQAHKIGQEGVLRGWRMPREAEALPRPDVRAALAAKAKAAREAAAAKAKAAREAAAAKFETEKLAALAKTEAVLATGLLVKGDWKRGIAWLDLDKWDALTATEREEAARVFGFLKADKTGQSASLKMRASPRGMLLAICYKDGKPQLLRKKDR